jgi:hypothetical protein
MNLSKHLKGCYQTKTNREMLKHDFHIFDSLMILFFPQKNQKKISYLFSHLCKILNQKKTSSHVYLNLFNHIDTFRKNYMTFCVWQVP